MPIYTFLLNPPIYFYFYIKVTHIPISNIDQIVKLSNTNRVLLNKVIV